MSAIVFPAKKSPTIEYRDFATKKLITAEIIIVTDLTTCLEIPRERPLRAPIIPRTRTMAVIVVDIIPNTSCEAAPASNIDVNIYTSAKKYVSNNRYLYTTIYGLFCQ